MHSVEGHRGRIEVPLRMLSHDDEIELVGFCGGNQLCERSCAVSSEKRVNVNHALVIDVLIVGRDRRALGRKLLNRRLQFAQAVAPVSERNLRDDEEQQNR